MDTNMKRDFDLPEIDEKYLNSLGLPWETVKSNKSAFGNSSLFLIIYGYYINTDYYRLDTGGEKVDVLLQIPSGYPNAQIDMASFSPNLIKIDNGHIPNLHAFYTVNDRNWQTWSRHRTGLSVWRPEIDFVGTHLEYVESFLQKEVGADKNDGGDKSSNLKTTFISKEPTGIVILQKSKKTVAIHEIAKLPTTGKLSGKLIKRK